MSVLLMFMLVAQAAQDSKLSNVDTAEVQALGKILRCPVCQGMPVGDSPSEMAVAMMKRVRELHAEGKSPDEIKAYFVARYGEWVLLEPRAEGINWLVWLLPFLAFALGIIGIGVKLSERPGEVGEVGVSETDDPKKDAEMPADFKNIEDVL